MEIAYPVAEIPFPSSIKTADLPVIDFELIKAGDAKEIDRMWEACIGTSFFYMKNTGMDPKPLIELGKLTFKESNEEKTRFPQGDTRYTFGYKRGFYDTSEIMNVGEDAVEAFLKNEGGRVAVESCDPVLEPVLHFMKSGHSVSMKLLSVFEEKLGIPRGSLTSRNDSKTGSGARITMTPPLKSGCTDSQVKSAEHYDFGNLAILFDNVGGLQFRTSSDSEWQWMKPIPGYASINTGDYLKALSGGKITSLEHRVLPPPGKQAALTRFSPVYFSRANWGVKAEPIMSIKMA